MKVKSSELEKAVKNASKACVKNSTVGYMALKLRAHNNVLSINGGSTQITVKTSVFYEGNDDFEVCVSQELLLSAVSKMKMADEITLTSGKQVSLKCNYATVNLTPVADNVIERSADEYPESVKVKGLKSILDQTSHCLAAEGQGDPKMSAFDIKISSTGIKVTTLDGRRISVRSTDEGEKELIVVGKPLMSVLQMMENDEVTISFPENGRFIMVTGENIEATVSVINGEYFNISSYIKTDFERYILLNRDKMLEALNISSLFGKISKVEIADGSLNMSAIDDKGSGQTTVAYSGSMRDIKFGVCNQYLIDALKSFDSEEIIFTMDNPKAPILMSDSRDGNTLEVVCPVAI